MHEGQSAPDIEVIGEFRRCFLKKFGRSVCISFVLLERNAASYLARFLISQCNVAWAGFFWRDVRLALIKIIIRACDPSIGIVWRLFPPFGEQRLDLGIGVLVQQLSVTASVITATRHLGLRLEVGETLQDFL